MTEPVPQPGPRDFGPQPLDALMDELNLTNHELVSVSTEQLTHKQIQKARKGRKVTRNIQQKIRNALKRATQQHDEKRCFALDELFNYPA